MPPYCYEFPRPALTVDAAVFCPLDGTWQVLLIRRANPPFQGHWALPGGFVDIDEPLETAAARELEEETGLRGIELEQLHTYGKPGRDPRGRTVSVVYAGLATPEQAAHARGADDAAAAAWHPIDQLPPTAFDHDVILSDAIEWLRRRLAAP